MHFLPYNKANRDEEFSLDDNARIAGAFTTTKPPSDGNVKSQFKTLKAYMEGYLQKIGKKSEEFKSSAPSKSQPDQTLRPGKPKRNSKGVPPGGKLGMAGPLGEEGKKSESADD